MKIFKPGKQPGGQWAVILITWIAAWIALAFVCDPVHPFDLPATDPWYFQSDQAMAFWIPDKAQHFYGSQLLVEGGMPLAVAFGAGFAWEAWQDGRGIGFSWKDLVANALGVIAGKVNDGTKFILVIYSTEQKTITLVGVVRL